MKYSLFAKVALCFIVLSVVACEPIITYSTDILHGKGDTAEGWVFTDGTVHINGDVSMNGSIPNTRIIFTLDPIKTGEVTLGSNLFDYRTITYFDGNVSHFFSKGKYEITEITDTVVRGRMYVWNSTMTFDGVFELVRTSY